MTRKAHNSLQGAVDRDGTTVSSNISRPVLHFLLGAIAIAGVHTAACSGQVDSREENSTAPVVKCGASDCAIGSKVCCFRRSGSATSQTCDDVADCPDTFPGAEPARTATECDQHEDCDTGLLCSHVSASGGSHTYCQLAAQANVHSPVADWYEVCESPVKANPCSGERSCTETNIAFPGWKFCAHLASD
ncbi:MAG: hypothetical protein ABW061_19185 [Polyangiaceae bacterium]